MATIFAIEQGCYSDYRVVGVFSSREKAEQILSIVNRDQDSEAATIAEWELDSGVNEINAGLKPHCIVMDIDGITERCYEDGDGYEAGGLHVWTRTAAPFWAGKPITDAVSGAVWAKDVKHAVKIANEYRIQAIAEGRMSRRD